MPLIKLNLADGSAVDINTDHIIQFYPVKDGTRIDLRDNLSHVVTDSSRSIRGYIGRATGTLPEKQEQAPAKD